MTEKMLIVIGSIIGIVLGIGISFLCVSALVWLMCFFSHHIPNFAYSINFSWGLAGLVWVILTLLKRIFSNFVVSK